MSPGTDSAAASRVARGRAPAADAEAKKKEAEILQRARSESAAELARLKTELSVSTANDAARQAAVVASRAAVDELKRLRGTAATDKAALASTAKALDELSKTEKGPPRAAHAISNTPQGVPTQFRRDEGRGGTSGQS